VVERTMVALALDAVRLTGLPRLALAGGVASNVKATRQIRLQSAVDDVYVMPHMGDGGLAFGAAALAALEAGDRVAADLGRLQLGHGFDDEALRAALQAAALPVERPPALAAQVAARLAAGDIVMWFQGRMEYGPRALGGRSVLARPDRLDLRDRLNLALKRRVWYQPFCPSMLESERPRLLADWRGDRNPCMTMAYAVGGGWRAALAGVTSVDGTCRPQFVPDDDPTDFAAVLREARRLWGVGVVLNTSYNIHGEPLVCTPAEAVSTFLRSGADALALGPFLVDRPQATPAAEGTR
jgi:carbamoyltransferase